jgi:hypothetical protein
MIYIFIYNEKNMKTVNFFFQTHIAAEQNNNSFQCFFLKSRVHKTAYDMGGPSEKKVSPH